MRKINNISYKLILLVENIGLFIIATATVIAFGVEIATMLNAWTVKLADLLLLFIYLEVLAMIYMYLESGKLPVQIPLYIAIIALSRYMILDMKALDNWRILTIAGAILLISFSILLHRYGQTKLPYQNKDSQ